MMQEMGQIVLGEKSQRHGIILADSALCFELSRGQVRDHVREV
jgi:hypothetical protein